MIGTKTNTSLKQQAAPAILLRPRASSQLLAPGSRLPPPGSWLPAPSSRLRAPGSRLPAPTSRLRAPGFRLPAVRRPWPHRDPAQQRPRRTSPQGQQLVLQDVSGVGAFIHQVQLGDDANGPQAWKSPAVRGGRGEGARASLTRPPGGPTGVPTGRPCDLRQARTSPARTFVSLVSNEDRSHTNFRGLFRINGVCGKR